MKLLFWTAVLFLFLFETYSLLPRPQSPGKEGKTETASRPFLQGIIHVHSNYSDGGGTPDQIAHAAQRAGMDFVILTDHNTSRARQDGYARKMGNLDFFVEMEAQTAGGHALVFFTHTDAAKLSDEKIVELSWQHFMGGAPQHPGIFDVVAHPSNIKNPWVNLDRFPEGEELINFDSVWRREVDESVLGFGLTALLYPFNNYLAALRFDQIYRKDFTSWDAMNMVSPGHFGILGHDTHSKLKINESTAFPWPDYEQSFRIGSNIIFYDPPLAEDYEARKAQIYRSIRQGRNALVLQFIHPFAGNDWHLTCGDKNYFSGDTVTRSDHCGFSATVPSSFPFPKVFRLWRDGEIAYEVTTTENTLHFPVTKEGGYRLEVWAKAHTRMRLFLRQEVPYLFYNPIYVKR
jgi:hypothetical protein